MTVPCQMWSRKILQEASLLLFVCCQKWLLCFFSLSLITSKKHSASSFRPHWKTMSVKTVSPYLSDFSKFSCFRHHFYFFAIFQFCTIRGVMETQQLWHFSPDYLSPFSNRAACTGPAGCLLTLTHSESQPTTSADTGTRWATMWGFLQWKSCYQHIKYTQCSNNLIMM